MRDRSKRHQVSSTSNVQFAAQAVDVTRLEDRKYLGAVVSTSKATNRSAWDWYEKIGEVHYAVGRGSRIAGYARLRVHKLDKNGDIGEPVTSGLAGEIADQLYSPYGGQRGLLERYFTLAKVPADSYLIGCRGADGSPDGIDFISSDEIKTENLLDLNSGVEISRITLPASSPWGEQRLEDRISNADFIGRVWRPSARYVDLPDSQLKALDVTCELLHLLTLGIKSKLLSRLASNGIFYIPNGVNDARSGAPAGEPGEFHQNKVLDELIRAATYAARNPGDPAAAIPIFMSGPAAESEAFRHIVMDQDLFATDLSQRAELIDRLLMGLDIQPTAVKGAQDSNHWGAWAANDDELKVNVQPDIETACWALTRLFLWRKMQEEGRKPGEIMKHVVWYDLSAASSHTNAAEDGRQALDRIIVSPSAARRMSGISERDAPTGTDTIRSIGIKNGDVYLATFGMPEAEKIDWEKVGKGKTGPSPASQAPDSGVQPGKGQPGSPADNKSNTPSRLRPA